MTSYDENLVPVLFRGDGERIGLSLASHEDVKAAHEAAQAAVADAYARRAAGDLDKDADGNEIDPVAAAHDAHLLIGASVLVHNPAPAGAIVTGPNGETIIAADAPSYTPHTIGASTLDEALKDVIGGMDMKHIGEVDISQDHIHTPQWVASTHPELASKLADYYSCEVRDISEVI